MPAIAWFMVAQARGYCIKSGLMSTSHVKIPAINNDPHLLLAELERISSKASRSIDTVCTAVGGISNAL